MIIQLVEFIQLLVPPLKSKQKKKFDKNEKNSNDLWASSSNDQFYNQESNINKQQTNFNGFIIKISVEKFVFNNLFLIFINFYIFF